MRRRHLLLAPLLAVVALAVLDRLFPPDLTRYERQGILLLGENGRLLSAQPAPDRHLRFAVRLDEVDADYLKLLKSTEDKWFDSHPGINPFAVARAGWQAVRHREIVSGASTLTMQTVRLLTPRPRTLTSKLIEMTRALQLEAHYSKREILEIYLTLAPYGGNIEGVRAASLVWFGKPLQRLTLAEAALLVALPQSPERLRPDRFPARTKAARARILDRAAADGLVTVAAAAEAKEASLPAHRTALPQFAPHLLERLERTPPARRRFDTTLDSELQKSFARLLAAALPGFEPEVAIAGLIVENGTGKVKAYVGSADYFAASRNGMVDMVTATRSPGSTLKPFIYGMAFEQLLVQPKTVIADVPLRFGSYVPANFDGGYHGEVTVAEALQRSLNLPAVALLDRIGPVSFDARLHDAGIRLRFDRRVGRPTLPIALGGVGLSLEELVRLYGAFTQGGRVSALQYLAGGSGAAANLVMPPAAAWQVAHILQDAPRPAGFSDPTAVNETISLGFKTGTSYGFRDAWAIGFTPGHTIGIWVGRADGAPCLNCMGLKAAAPLLMKTLALLPAGMAPANVPIPRGIIRAAATADLPLALQRFSLKSAESARSWSELVPPLRLAFPVDGSEVEVSDRHSSLPLRAEGGTRPFIWLVNGIPLAADRLQREARWPADETGFLHITVRDAMGQSATAETFLRRTAEKE